MSNVNCHNMADVNSDKESAGKRGKPKKEVKAFSSKETEKLINLWATKEALYNCRYEDYFNRDSCTAALKRIVEKLEKEGTY